MRRSDQLLVLCRPNLGLPELLEAFAAEVAAQELVAVSALLPSADN